MGNLWDYNVTNPIVLVCLSFALGLIVSLATMKPADSTLNMRRSMIILPPLVCAALLAVNGNIGTSIAIMGVFGLVRFRSVEGSSKDIVQVFLAMVIGLLCSTGRIIMTVLLAFILTFILFFSKKLIPENNENYCLKILVPENMNFTDVFDEILGNYFKLVKLTKIKSTNMGSLYELNYSVTPRKDINIKEMLDDIRTHNGNLTVSYYRDQNEQLL